MNETDFASDCALSTHLEPSADVCHWYDTLLFPYFGKPVTVAFNVDSIFFIPPTETEGAAAVPLTTGPTTLLVADLMS